MSKATQKQVEALKLAGEDFEWYPTTDEMIDVVARDITPPAYREGISILDVGAGDGRALKGVADRLGEGCNVSLYAIERAMTLVEAQPREIVPLGTDFYEQKLVTLECDYVFSNPPYLEYEAWAQTIIADSFALRVYLVIPQRWKGSKLIDAAIKARDAEVRVLWSGDFLEADRASRAKVDIVRVDYKASRRRDADPFTHWFDAYADQMQPPKAAPEREADIVPKHDRKDGFTTIVEMVAAYDEEWDRMEKSFTELLQIDRDLLREVGVNRDTIRESLQKRMQGLKSKYWSIMFDRLDAITSRLTTATKAKFLEKLTGQQGVGFTASNAYAVVVWALKHANRYFDEQIVTLFKDMADFDGVSKYKSNTQTWEKGNWRFNNETQTHYALDYRIVVHRWKAIPSSGDFMFEFTGGLYNKCHEFIADIVAVFSNFGYRHTPRTAEWVIERKAKLGKYYSEDENGEPVYRTSLDREWVGGKWQDFHFIDANGKAEVLFQVKAFQNGNLHFRFRPEAIRQLNVEAGRLLGWLHSPQQAADEMDMPVEEAEAYFRSTPRLTTSNLKCLGQGSNADRSPLTIDRKDRT